MKKQIFQQKNLHVPLTLFRKKWFMFLIAGVVGVCLSFIYDVEISLFFQGLRNPHLTSFLIGLTFLSNIIILFFFLTSLFLWQEHKRRWILPLWMSLFFSVAVSYVLKIFVRRPRPFLSYPLSILVMTFKEAYLTWNSSFPSFHAMLIFSALPVLNKEFRKFKYVWLGFAVLIGFSRVYLGVHYFSDVLAGAGIGYLIGIVLVKIEEKYGFGKKLVGKFGEK